MTKLCVGCEAQGFCQKLNINVPMADDIENPVFRFNAVRTVKRAAASGHDLKIRLGDELARFAGRFWACGFGRDKNGRTIVQRLDVTDRISMDAFEIADDAPLAPAKKWGFDGDTIPDHGKAWLDRVLNIPDDPAKLPMVRPESMMRWIVLLAIIKAMYPMQARRWHVPQGVEGLELTALARAHNHVPIYHLPDGRRLDYMRRGALKRAYRDTPNRTIPRRRDDACPHVALISFNRSSE